MNAKGWQFWLNLLKGWDFPPVIVGVVRAVISASVLAGLAALNTQVHLIDWTHFGVIASPIVSAATGSAWAGADQRIDPDQNTITSKADQTEVRK